MPWVYEAVLVPLIDVYLATEPSFCPKSFCPYFYRPSLILLSGFACVVMRLTLQNCLGMVEG